VSVAPQSASSGRARRWLSAAGLLEQRGARSGTQAIVPAAPQDANPMRRYV
jgi:hypothetical protein